MSVEMGAWSRDSLTEYTELNPLLPLLEHYKNIELIDLFISTNQRKTFKQVDQERQNGVGGMGVDFVIPGDEESTCGVREQGTYLWLHFIALRV